MTSTKKWLQRLHPQNSGLQGAPNATHRSGCTPSRACPRCSSTIAKGNASGPPAKIMRSRSSGWVGITQCPINRLGFPATDESLKLDRQSRFSGGGHLALAAQKMLPERGRRRELKVILTCSAARRESGLGMDHQGQQRRGAGRLFCQVQLQPTIKIIAPVDCCRDSPALLSPLR